MYILASWINSTGPVTGLSPTITARKLSDNSVILNAVAMSEVGNGGYKYEWTTYDAGEEYYLIADGGSNLDWALRYKISGTAEGGIDAIKIKTDNIPSDPA